MRFDVRPDDLDAFSGLIRRASEDAEQGKLYLGKWAQLSSDEQGLFTRLFDLHGSLEQDASYFLGKLQRILSASSDELSRSAAYYREIDKSQAANIDAKYPKSKR